MPVTNIRSRWHEGDLVFDDKDGNELVRLHDGAALGIVQGAVYNKRVRATAAEVNAAGGKELLPALTGYAYRLVDWTLIAIGGNAATATSVDIVGTRSAAEVRPAVVAVAALTRSTAVKPNSANVTLLADGASHTPLDSGTAVSLQKQSGGSSLATATHIDAIISYTIEKV
jgi:hypothetical protein